MGLKLLMTMPFAPRFHHIAEFAVLPNRNMAPRDVDSVFSRMNILKNCVSPYTEFTCVTDTSIFRRPSLRAKGHWHALCFTKYSLTEHHSEAGKKVVGETSRNWGLAT